MYNKIMTKTTTKPIVKSINKKVKQPKNNPKNSIKRISSNNSDTVSGRYKYTPKFVYEELVSMIEYLKDNEEVCSKTQLLATREYSPSRFYGWCSKYSTNVRIHELLKRVDNTLESRLVTRGLNGKAIPMTIFLLKNYYNYTDQYQTKVDQTISFKVNRGMKTIESTVAPIRSKTVKLPATTNE